MSDSIIGIDLGTTNSVVAVADQRGQTTVIADKEGFKVQPSVVAFHPNGKVLVGAAAKQRRIIDPENTIYSAKRLIGQSYDSPRVQEMKKRLPYEVKEGPNKQPVIVTRAGQFAVPEIAGLVLDYMHKLAAEAMGHDVPRAVITVPANFTDAQRQATSDAGAIAGIEVQRVLNEPTAAALAYGHRRKLSRVIAVYDFGGGTFDITLLKTSESLYEVIGTAGDSFLGGDDIDERIVGAMAQKFLAERNVDLRTDPVAMQRLRAMAERVKIELTRRKRVSLKIAEIAYGPGGKPLDIHLAMEREELEAHAAEIVSRTFPVCDEALRRAGLKPQDVQDIVLVGGTTKMPLVRTQVASYFRKSPHTDINPDEAVAIGAALQAVALRRVQGPGRPSAPRAATKLPAAPPLQVVIPPAGPSRGDITQTTQIREDAWIKQKPRAGASTDEATQVPGALALPRALSAANLGAPITPPITSETSGEFRLASELGEEGDEDGGRADSRRITDERPNSRRITDERPARASSDLEFDFDLGGLAEPPTAESTRPPLSGRKEQSMELDLSSLEFEGSGLTGEIDLGASSSGLDVPASIQPSAAALASQRSDSSLELDLSALELGDSSAGMPVSDASDPGLGLHADGGDDFGLELVGRPQRPGAPSGAGIELDLSYQPATGRVRSSDDAHFGTITGEINAILDDDGTDGGGAVGSRALYTETGSIALNSLPLQPQAGESRNDLPASQSASPKAPAGRGGSGRTVMPAALKAAMQTPPMQQMPPAQMPPMQMPPALAPAVPVVLDVTPHTLGIVTVAGICEGLILRNTRLPAEKARVFSSSKDHQQVVRIRICQGESRRIEENTVLGDLLLEGLAPELRGQTQIEVMFRMDVNGMLEVVAHDVKTGLRQQSTVAIIGGQSREEVEAAAQRLRTLSG